MTRTSHALFRLACIVIGLAVLAVAAWQYVRQYPSIGLIIRRAPTMAAREQRARERFLREHSGAQPLNVAIGQAAMQLHKSKPMGKFVLGIGWDDKGNDCSDFVKCAVDEGVGLKARFKRGSDKHLIGDSYRYTYEFLWDRQTPLLPGDTVAVKHSPWYEPYPGACWHVGIIGADGMVYDFVKLKRWPEPKYGRNKLGWFVRNSAGPNEVLVRRLLPEYRYRLRDVRNDFEQDVEDKGKDG